MYLSSVSDTSRQYLIQSTDGQPLTVPGNSTVPNAIALPLLVVLIMFLLRSSRHFGNSLFRTCCHTYQNYRANLRWRQIRTLERIFNRDSASY